MPNEHETKAPTLAIMCGLPKSGKSTIIDKDLRGYQVICGDDIRLALGVEFDQRLEDFVWGTAHTMVRASLIRGLDVVIDGTHTTKYRREKMINLGKYYGAEIRIIFVRTPYEVCAERAEKDGFPIEVLDRMNESLTAELPSKEEGADYLVEVSLEIVHGIPVVTEYIK